ncbi:MAG: hypothetical protein HY397_03250 [Candidatus Doudnabacteria bacterium]|nr:hypothetical protein [Candidatus Doudnabacteria bacterium]
MAMTRRQSFLMLPLVFERLWAYSHLTTRELKDGTLYAKGFINGMAFESYLKIRLDRTSVERYEVFVIPQRTTTVETVLAAADLEIKGQTKFPVSPTLDDKLLVVGAGNVTGNFYIKIDGWLFQDAGATDKMIGAGQKLQLIALPGAKLASY